MTQKSALVSVHQHDAHALVPSPDGSRLAYQEVPKKGDQNGDILVVNQTHPNVGLIRIPFTMGPVQTMAFSPDSWHLAICGARGIEVYHIALEATLVARMEPTDLYCQKAVLSGDLLAVSEATGYLNVFRLNFETKTMKQIANLSIMCKALKSFGFNSLRTKLFVHQYMVNYYRIEG